ncbi:helix-turn-helix transcriptional regulator [Methylocella sp. CPCC 101449]|uniref:helix-turn-helix transcriptional regulator n=1 Tax=Methylocella sp. CPCC 101449 TaxID=2987531 RepID=UPI00288E5E02|nr:helix-turn-helix transcriptional regulator [Methylocella sp. CPCC 101449]MDT2024613.1 helix-turn-helix transcriptional regulator [Methylocella sp. CPCC 101449]
MNRITVESITAAIGEIYEAAYEQERWSGAMRTLGDLFGASRACIVRILPNPDGTRFNKATGSYADPEFETLVVHHAAAEDPLTFAMIAQPAGSVYRRRDIIDEDAFRHREMWLRWFKPREMDEAISCNLHISGASSWSLDISRMTKFGAFGHGEINLLQKIVPHIARAGQIGEALDRSVAINSVYAGMPFGILVADTNLRVLHLNESAEALLGRASAPLTLKGGRLAALYRSDLLSLSRLVDDCCRSPLEDASAPGGTIILPRHRKDTRGPRLLVSVAPMAASCKYGLGTQHCAAVMIREVAIGTSTGIPSNALVMALFDLSPAEARLALRLAIGVSLTEAARDCGLSIASARTYLSRIFSKTGTHSQHQLVALLRSAGSLGSSEST